MDEDRSGSPFPQTHWTLVRRAGGDGTSGRSALGELLAAYLPALRRHLVHRFRMPPERAEDTVQSFIASKILERQLLRSADGSKGRFRTFLLTALDRHAADAFRRERASKRGGHAAPAAFDDALEPADAGAAGPDDAFELDWAQGVIARAIKMLRDECLSAGRDDLWQAFEARLLGPLLRGATPEPLDALAARLGRTPDQVSNLGVTAKRSFKRCLRAVVGEYEREPDRVDAEIADLQAIVARPRGGP